MSEPTAVPRGRVALAALVPGLLQFAEGRRAQGGTALLVWLGLGGLLLARPREMASAVGGPLDGKVAAATVVAGLLITWAWSVASVVRPARTARTGLSQWTLTARTFATDRTAVAGLVAILVFYLLALVAPLIAPYDPAFQGDLLSERLLAPSGAHPLGTDRFARDVLSRLLYGARVSLAIGFVAVGISVSIGTVLGAVAGYLGGVVDMVIMRFVDMVLAFPRLVLLILISAQLEPSIFLIAVILGLTQWPGTTRLVRGEALSLREREFIQAAKALGYSSTRIIARHLVPNTLSPIIVVATLGIGNTIVLEAGLSFLGLGVQPPTPSWGTMVADGRGTLLDAWWIATFPGLAIVLTVLAFNLVGDGLRDATDPRLRV